MQSKSHGWQRSTRIHRALFTFGALFMLSCVLLTACATSEDPAKGDFFSGLKGLSTGAYEQRLEQKQSELDASRSEATRQRQELETIEAETARTRMQREQAEERLDALSDSLEVMRRKLVKAEHAGKIDAAQLRHLDDEIASLQQAQSLIKSSPNLEIEAKTRRITDLEQRKKRLEATLIDALGQL